MQIVINITEEDYKKIRETSFVENTEIMFKQSSEDRKGTMMLFRVIDAIKNGTLLPKGHGDLKDANKIEALLDLDKADNEIAKALKNIIESVPTIVEADKESEGKK